MTKKMNGPDEELRELFQKAREKDAASAPTFRQIREREAGVRSGAPRPKRSRIVPIASLSAAASVVITVAAIALVIRSGPPEMAEAPREQGSRVTVVSNDQRVPDVQAPAIREASGSEQSSGRLDALGQVTPGSRDDAAGRQGKKAPSNKPSTKGKSTVPALTPVPPPTQLQSEVASYEAELKEQSARSSAVQQSGAAGARGSHDANYLVKVENAEGSSSFAMRSDVADKFGPESMIERVRGRDYGEADAPAPGFNTESYAHLSENEFKRVEDHPLSTFSIDVDTASYANVRRMLRAGQAPPPGAVRIEEMINYFDYSYPQPRRGEPFSVTLEIAGSPWDPDHRLARIGLRGRELSRREIAGRNLVFLIDVSGSMNQPSKLPLLKESFTRLVSQLEGDDTVAIVVYAGSSGLVLDATPGNARGEILSALSRLKAGGSTNGGEGLRLAYRIARDNFIRGGVNRVILATDGDFNVGVTSHSELLAMIEKDAADGIALTALGFGMGNYKDDRLELLADKGNGNYAYIDTLAEAHKVLVEQLDGTLVTIAKDVKIQIEFNPTEVAAYRLIGYENRMLAKEDFKDDTKDAGEIGAGHTVTALYEIVPAWADSEKSNVDPLKYQSSKQPSEGAYSGELFTLKLRHKKPAGERSRQQDFVARDPGHSLEEASDDFKFASAVALFGMKLRGSEHAGDATLSDARRLAIDGMGGDKHGYRAEFVELVDLAARHLRD